MEYKQQELIAKLNDMLSFATENLSSMLNIMGFSTVEQLNEALHNYNQLNISLQDLFPAMSEPQITEVLARSGIGNMTQNTDYELVISALKDSIERMFPDFTEQVIQSSQGQELLRQTLEQSGAIEKIATEAAGQLFGGIKGGMDIGVIDFGNGQVNLRLDKLASAINKNAKAKGVTSTTSRTIEPFVKQFLVPALRTMLKSDFELFTNKESYEELEKILMRQQQSSKIKREIITERIRRGGVTTSVKVNANISANDNGVMVTPYLEQLQVGVDRNIFNLENRGKENIESYVNRICNENPGVKDQIIKNIKSFYWNIIKSYLPQGVNNPLTEEKYNEIINQMVSKESGSIGWFFSQGTTKAGGAGMFGEIAGMIYLSVLCPKLKDNAKLIWAGGVIEGGAKPPADIILEGALSKYGIQVKNYTSGSILTHEYNLKIKNIIDDAANKANNQDLMIAQATSELGITEEEVEAVQNIIIANTFNIPYQEDSSGKFFAAKNDIFSPTRSKLDQAYLQATRYMALISVIMHRLQYREEIIRNVGNNKNELQLQNTLWLVNGAMFISSVQILEQLIKYIQAEEDKFFNISTSLRIKKKNAIDGLKEGNFTIVEYYNYSAKGLGTTALSKVSASIGTNYRMSMFGV